MTTEPQTQAISCYAALSYDEFRRVVREIIAASYSPQEVIRKIRDLGYPHHITYTESPSRHRSEFLKNVGRAVMASGLVFETVLHHQEGAVFP